MWFDMGALGLCACQVNAFQRTVRPAMQREWRVRQTIVADGSHRGRGRLVMRVPAQSMRGITPSSNSRSFVLPGIRRTGESQSASPFKSKRRDGVVAALITRHFPDQ